MRKNHQKEKKEKIVKEKNGEEGKDEEGEEEILNWQDIKVCFVRAKRESGPAWPAFTPEMLRAVSSLKLVEPKKNDEGTCPFTIIVSILN